MIIRSFKQAHCRRRLARDQKIGGQGDLSASHCAVERKNCATNSHEKFARRLKIGDELFY